MPIRPKLPFGEETLTRLAAAISPLGVELCHVEWKQGPGRGVLSLTIDREAGVTLEHCEKATRAAEAVLDEIPELDAAYSLEVSSPGLDRPLWTLDDCRRFVGKRVRLTLFQKYEGAARLRGTLERVDGDALVVLDEDQSRSYTVRFDDVKLARLVPEL
jgi:ribosome maturation factor RimP